MKLCTKVTVASAGDSRAVLSRNKRAIVLSEDHKPEDAPERRRIIKAGGRVVLSGPCYRIDGTLNLSRALGNFKMKSNRSLPSDKQRVICHPDVREHSMEEGDDFLLLACDGLFEKFSRQGLLDAIHEIRNQWNDTRPTSWKDCASEVALRAISRKPEEPGNDNETVTIITWKKCES